MCVCGGGDVRNVGVCEVCVCVCGGGGDVRRYVRGVGV